MSVLWFCFYPFPLFLGKVVYDNEFETKKNEKKNKTKTETRDKTESQHLCDQLLRVEVFHVYR